MTAIGRRSLIFTVLKHFKTLLIKNDDTSMTAKKNPFQKMKGICQFGV